MSVRLATLNDFPRVTQMLRQFLMEQWDAGAPVRMSHKNLEVYRDLARCYLTGSLFGVVGIDEGCHGFALAGEEIGVERFETILGRTATFWAVWTPPERRRHGDARELALLVCKTLGELGFDTLIMAARCSADRRLSNMNM